MKTQILSAAITAAALLAAEPPMTWTNEELFSVPKVYSDAGYEEYRKPGLRSFFIEGPKTSDGEETRAYAYYALPTTPKPEGGYPAIVLVHGGGSTAWYHYVQAWQKRGYAVIMVDHYGHLPKWQVSRVNRPILPESWQGRAQKIGTYGEGNPQMRHLWLHNAIALAVRANTFLHQQPEINAKKIGIAGGSWGSVISGVATSLDSRFAYAILIYGCGNWDVSTNSNSFLKYSSDSFEPKYFLSNVKLPALWIAGTNDAAFEIAAWQKSYQQAPGTVASSLVVRLDHGPTAFGYEIALRFADACNGLDTPLPKISPLRIKGNRAEAAILEEGEGILQAELNYTMDTVPDVTREWKSAPADFKDGVISAVIPDGAKALFLNAYDRRYTGHWQWPVSTDVVEISGETK